ncbi:MAG: phosphoribosylformylglycinamidine synthase subunit PurL [Dehalococcoidia bacterium]|nr:phosphoribosylformylglycinamidine synthase subunit PurL [Dehalococcoidia bacterium]
MIDDKTLYEVALSREEYDLIVEKLGRKPTRVELGMFGAMWSEHCGYKSSKPLLGLFPTKGPRVVAGAGEENAGAVDIGDGLAVVFKMESHNHPSAIEPYQGAATGVGGIIRDIFTMGARPIALLDSLRFGPLDKERNRYLFSGVVGGIAGYGNCIGIPTVGGEIYFADAYSNNPLVNVMCVGIAEIDSLVQAKASGPGNPLMLIGADTGRDGIHGATFASVELDDRSEERRPAVQVGNPFLEKLLMEACLELAKTDYIVGMQDLGAAGLTSSSVECAHKGRTGVVVDVGRVSRRETGMNAYEIMLSESQERMLVIVKKGFEDKVKGILDRYDLHSDIIGEVTSDNLVTIKDGPEVVAQAPTHFFADNPVYHRETRRPAYLDEVQTLELRDLPEPSEYGRVLLDLLASPNIASREYVYRQYDHQVLTNTMILPGEGDSAVLRIKGTKKAIAVTTDGNSRYCYLDPYNGAAIAVAEAARNLVCSGAVPLAVTNCLNFGNPEKPEIFWGMEQSVRGMAEACRVLETPVVSGNVSLYNETDGEPIYPTPVVGMVGLLEDASLRCTASFKDEADAVVLISAGEDGPGLGGSEYLLLQYGKVAGKPTIVLDSEKRVQDYCLRAIHEGIINSAHDCSEGGLAVALAECCILGRRGFSGRLPQNRGQRADLLLFGEGQSRIVVSLKGSNLPSLREMGRENGVRLTDLGTVEGDRLVISGLVDLPLDLMDTTWRGAIERSLK